MRAKSCSARPNDCRSRSRRAPHPTRARDRAAERPGRDPLRAGRERRQLGAADAGGAPVPSPAGPRRHPVRRRRVATATAHVGTAVHSEQRRAAGAALCCRGWRSRAQRDVTSGEGPSHHRRQFLAPEGVAVSTGVLGHDDIGACRAKSVGPSRRVVVEEGLARSGDQVRAGQA